LQTTLLPTAVWGTQFPLVPFVGLETDQKYQIVAHTDGTIVSADRYVLRFNAGEHATVMIANGSAILSSNYPIQLIQLGMVVH